MKAYKLGRWNLKDLLAFHRGPEFDQTLAQLEARVAKFEQQRPHLSDEMEETEFLTLVRDSEETSRIARRVGSYAGLWFTENTQNGEALTFQRQVDQRLTELTNRTLFFSLWWKSLRDDAAARLMANSGDYRYFLERQRAFKPHTLAESEEQIINLKDVAGIDGLVTVYDMLTNKFQFTLKTNGRTKTLTREELMTYARGADPKLRAAAYREMFRVYGENQAALSQIYAYRIQDWRNENIKLRHFTSPLSVRNLANDIPEAATEALLKVCRANAKLFQRYFKYKARALGIPSGKLRRYDLYAPIAPSDKKFPYADAVEMVLASFNSFSPTVGKLAQQVFQDQHVDSEIRAGKSSGAFCASVLPGMTPYVLLNYTGRARDVSTMAHELGHAIHALLARDHSTFTFHSALPLAETASVFGEMMLNDRLLANEKDTEVLRDLRANQIDDIYASVMRQAYFVMFERDAHEMFTQGKTTDQVAEHYLENLHEQFGDSMDIADEFKWEWIVIPHFYHTPFYVYAYSFGTLLSLALYKRYRDQGESFKPSYLKILSYGGSASPQKILGEAGIDITSEKFWQGGFYVIKGWIDELEALPAKKKRKRK